jgi:transposase InsO family protein
MLLKKEFVGFAVQSGVNMRQLCRRYGVSAATGYKWLHRYQSEGWTGLAEQSRRPRHSPGQTGDEVVALILSAARENPFWGARKLKALLENKGHTLPAASTVHTLLQRNGLHLSNPEASSPVGRFEHDAPNDLWQMDFKGHFETAFGRCHPLTLLDDHSRFLLALFACIDEKRETVQSRLIEVFETYGVPNRMTMDNGAPWGDTTGTFTKLERWRMRQGVRVGHSRPYHPQTQGKLERLHRSLKAEWLQGPPFLSLEATQRAFETWRDRYNQERPHEALAQQPPASRYQPARRDYQPTPAPPEYDENLTVRKGDTAGRLCFKGQTLKVGKAFIRECLGIREEAEDGIYSLWWYTTPIGRIDLKQASICVGKNR